MEKITKNEAKHLLKQMMQIRQFEDAIMDLMSRNIAEGGSHLYAGEEACAVGAMAAIRPDDLITSTHRGHGHAIAKGGSLPELMAESWAKRPVYVKARAVPCTWPTSQKETWAPTESWAAASESRPAPDSQSSCAAPTRSSSASLEMAQPTPDFFTNR